MSRRPIIPGIRSSAEAPHQRAGELFREAMARWTSGVAVLAVRDEDEVVGLTVSAFSSVSLDPPLVLVCVGEQAAVLPFVLEIERFTINVLGESSRAAASRFSQQMPDDPSLFATGDPVLRGATASLVCTLHAMHPGGDHRIVVGRVERVVIGRDEAPLLYRQREYRTLS